MTVLASGIILYRLTPEGPHLLLLRNSDNGHWGFPKGRRSDGDDHEIVTARREVAEETGYGELAIEPLFRHAIDYLVQGTADHGRYKRVVYFLARAPDREPDLSHEHDDFRWVGAREVHELLAFGQLRDLAQRALAAITHPTRR